MRLVLIALVLAGCGGTPPAAGPPVPRDTPAAADTTAIDIARLEARRGQSVPELTRRAAAGDLEARLLAVRALGRIGDQAAVAALVELAGDPEPAIVEAAMWWLGAAGDEAGLPAVRSGIAATDPAIRLAAIESLGRIGTADDLPAVRAALAEPALAPAAAEALGRMGRRAIAFDPPTRAGLSAALAGDDPDLVRAAAWAAWREHEPPDDQALGKALARVLESAGDPVTRSYAAAALGHRPDPAAHVATLLRALPDDDWRVQVEVVRALAGLELDFQQAKAMVTALDREMADLAAEPGRVHVLVAALHGLLENPGAKAAMIGDWIADDISAGLEQPADPGQALDLSTLHCHLEALPTPVEREPNRFQDVLGCGGPEDSGLPLHVRREIARPVLVELAAAVDVSSPVVDMAGHSDPRVEAVAVGIAADLLAKHSAVGDPDPAVHGLLVYTITGGLLSDSAPVVDAAAAGVVALTEATGPEAAKLAALVLERTRTTTDPELRLALLAHALKLDPEAVEPVCRELATDPNRTVRAQARECLTKATGSDPGLAAPRSAPELPAADLSRVGEQTVIWTLETTRGPIVIRLDGGVAPWHVATIIELTRSGFYDGVLWHRVVPNFVAQTGDPTGTGWGGPGFQLPGEPSRIPYERGTVGIADAGMDTGGSQFFIMHTSHPHLTGRYTVVGQVTQGMDNVDQLLVGDRIVKATISVIDTDEQGDAGDQAPAGP